MKVFFLAIYLCWLILLPAGYSQTTAIDRFAFFNDTSIIHATLITDLYKILNKKIKKGVVLHGNFITSLPDGTKINDQILLETRGSSRLDLCYLPPVKLKFDFNKSSVLYSLNTLKLVNTCKISKDYEQILLKEYIIYKIYNLLTRRSFNVRLLHLRLEDSSDKKKPISEYAFLLEDINDLAKRNNCMEWKRGKLNTEATDRRQMTMVAIFEYMIGNTDWAVPKNHNIKLIVSLNDSNARPFAVPFDFDYSGFVNAHYAIPEERLNIENVKERQYRGFPRNLAEIEAVLNIFKQQKTEIYALINQFDLLNGRSKQDISDYLDEFYNLIDQPDLVKSIFIDNALEH